MMLEDKLLIWRFKQGQVDALQQIYDKYKGELLKLAIALTADVCLAEDVVQDVFIKLAEAHDRISIRGNLKNYLITCLLNRIRTLRRDGQRREVKSATLADQEVTPVPRPDQWAQQNETMEMLVSALAQLPLDQREVITLRFHAGFGFRQIARAQGVSINTAHGRYRYGLEKLRSLLNGEVTK